MTKKNAQAIWNVIKDQAFIAGFEALCDGESFTESDLEKFVDAVDRFAQNGLKAK